MSACPFNLPLEVVDGGLYEAMLVDAWQGGERAVIYQGSRATAEWLQDAVGARVAGYDADEQAKLERARRVIAHEALLEAADRFRLVVESLGWDAIGGDDCDLKTDVYEPLMRFAARCREV